MKIKRNIAISLIKDLIQDEKFKKELIDMISSTSDSSGVARHEEKKIFKYSLCIGDLDFNNFNITKSLFNNI